MALVFAGALGRWHRGGAGPGAGSGPAGAAMEAAVGETVPSTGLAGRGAAAHLSFLPAFLCRDIKVFGAAFYKKLLGSQGAKPLHKILLLQKFFLLPYF